MNAITSPNGLRMSIAIVVLMVLIMTGMVRAGTGASSTYESPSASMKPNTTEVEGCYDTANGTCDCEIDADDCMAQNGDDDDASNKNFFMTSLCEDKCSAPDPSIVVAGCLVTGKEGKHHSCSCSYPKSSCEANGHLWTETCACYQGCYSEKSHECDCQTTKDECQASPSDSNDDDDDDDVKFWTSLCNAKCRDPIGFMPGCLKFDETGSHGCDCSIDEDTCKSSESDVWTDSCDCTVEPVLGCYDNAQHTCDCEISREDCELTESGMWSGLCTDKCLEGDSVTTGCLVFEAGGAHQCSCSVPEDQCTGQSKIFTEACACYPGCYDEESHMCDCDKGEDKCLGESETFTSACNVRCEDEVRHKAGCLLGFSKDESEQECDCTIEDEEACALQGDTLWTDMCQCYYPAGCYDSQSHKCDCTISERDCLSQVTGEGRPQFYWTKTCIGSSGGGCSEDEFGLRPTGQEPGCYNGQLHQCDCELTKEECSNADEAYPDVTFAWVDGCNCPARLPIGDN